MIPAPKFGRRVNAVSQSTGESVSMPSWLVGAEGQPSIDAHSTPATAEDLQLRPMHSPQQGPSITAESLGEELRRVERELEAANATHAKALIVAETEDSLRLAKSKLLEAHAARNSAAERTAARKKSFEDKIHRELEELRKNVCNDVEQKASQRIAELQMLVENKSAEVSRLSAENEQQASALQKVDYNEVAVHDMSKAVVKLLAGLRSDFKVNMKAVVTSEVRLLTADLASQRHRERENDASDRKEQAQRYVQSRMNLFDEFRQVRLKERASAASRIIEEVRTKHVDQGESKKKDRLEAQRREAANIELAELKMKTEIRQSLERLHAKHSEELATTQRQYTARELELHQRLSHEEERVSATYAVESQALRRSLDAEEVFATTISRGRCGIEGDFRVASEDLANRVKLQTERVESAIAQTRNAARTPTELQKLVKEREEVVNELQATVRQQEDAMRREWVKLSSLFIAMEKRSDDFEKTVRHGRAALSALQLQTEHIRSMWEKEVRLQLAAAVQPGGVLSSSSPEDIAATVLFAVERQLCDLMTRFKTNAGLRKGWFEASVSREDHLSAQLADVFKAIGSILNGFDRLSKLSAEVSSRQSWFDAEMEDLHRAQQLLEEEKVLFRNSVELLRQATEHLRQETDHTRLPSHLRPKDPNWRGKPVIVERQRYGPPLKAELPGGSVDSSSSSTQSRYRHLYPRESRSDGIHMESLAQLDISEPSRIWPTGETPATVQITQQPVPAGGDRGSSSSSAGPKQSLTTPSVESAAQ
jgi:hypothetical protein